MGFPYCTTISAFFMDLSFAYFYNLNRSIYRVRWSFDLCKKSCHLSYGIFKKIISTILQICLDHKTTDMPFFVYFSNSSNKEKYFFLLLLKTNIIPTPWSTLMVTKTTSTHLYTWIGQCNGGLAPTIETKPNTAKHSYKKMKKVLV